MLSGLRRRNIDLGRGQGDPAVRRRQRRRRAGRVHRARLGRADRAAPGDAMTPDAQDTATEIEVRIARASPRSEEFALLPDPLADALLDFEVPQLLRARLRGEGRRLYPDRRSVRPAVLRLPLLQCARPAEGDRARPRQHRHAHAAGARLSGAGPVRQGVRPGFPAAGGAGAGHLRAARQFRAGLHLEILRGHGLFRPRQLLGQFQRCAGALWRQAAARLGGAQPLLQHRHRPQQRALSRRAVVAARRLRAVPRPDRPGVRVVGLPGRHRRRQRLEPDAGPHPHLSDKGALLARGGLPQDSRFRASDDQGNRVPSAPLRAHAQLHRISRLLAAQPLQQRRADRRILGGQRARGDDRPLAPAQVRGDGAGCRDPAAARGDARRAPAVGRAGGLFRHVPRDRRHARRLHHLPPGQGQFPLHRRRRGERPRAARAGGRSRACAPGCAPRPTSCTTSRSRARTAGRS